MWSRIAILTSLAALAFSACTTLPEPKHEHFSFPRHAYFNEPERPYEKLGVVRSKAEYDSLDADSEEQRLCDNYFNKAVRDLVKIARAKGADAVIDVRSIAFMEDGSHELYPSAECSDDGALGQVLVVGEAVKWRPVAEPSPSPSAAPSAPSRSG